MPLISFVIPCYNYGRYLQDCLDGIFSQDANYDFEIIAVNDGSPDNTIRYSKENKDPRLKIIDRRQNRGHIYTVNEGLQVATGKYICRIDPDDRHGTSLAERYQY
ncbi:MAG: glycosyltransferase family 2 protein [Pirellulales bacterium]